MSTATAAARATRRGGAVARVDVTSRLTGGRKYRIDARVAGQRAWLAPRGSRALGRKPGEPEPPWDDGIDHEKALTDAEEATREAWFEALRPDDPVEICVRRVGFVPGVVYARRAVPTRPARACAT